VVGVIGVWVVERPVSDAAVNLLRIVENSAGVVRQATGRIDQSLASLEARTTEISESAQQISQNVADQGLVLVLLPQEKEQQLVDTAESVRDTFAGIRESIAGGLDLYNSINRLPFVNLPGLDEEQVRNLEDAMAQTEAQVESLRSDIAGIRSGVAGAIDKVVAAVDQITQDILDTREELAEVDSNLAELESLSIRLQRTIPNILIAIAVILTFILAFVIYTQVEVIRLYVARWRLLGTPMLPSPAEPPVEPTPEGEVEPDVE
jgi:chromosome segregation ATPase